MKLPFALLPLVLLVAPLATSAAATQGAQDPPANKIDHAAMAALAYESENWSAAAASYGTVTEAEPNNAEAHFRIAVAWTKLGKLYKAIPAHQKAMSFDGYRATATYNLACAFALGTRFDDAVEALQLCVDMRYPDLVEDALRDPDFEGLRERPEFAEWLREARDSPENRTATPPTVSPASASDARCIVLLNGASRSVRLALHRSVASSGEGWWNHVEGAWVVSGRNPAWWRDRLSKAIEGRTFDALLVLGLQPASKASWAYFGIGAETRCKWFQRSISAIPPAPVVRHARGNVSLNKTWDNGSYPLGGQSYDTFLVMSTGAMGFATLKYRGETLTIRRVGQRLQIKPYDNTSATATVRELQLNSKRVRVVLDVSGTTRNPSSVFAGGFSNGFSGTLTIDGTWDPNGLRVHMVDQHAWEGLGNAKWEGRSVLR